MEHKELSAPLNLYDESLTTISGIKFTHREMDIITFIFHTRGSSKIASLLSISNRTVETHTANIMRKMDTNSREGIIDFVSKHGHTLRIKKHYQALLVQLNFTKRLQEVFRLTKNKNFTSTIVFNDTTHEERTFLNALKGHLGLCGISTVLIENKDEKPIGDVSSQNILEPNDHILYLVPQKFLEAYQNNSKNQTKSIETLNLNSGTFTFLTWGMKQLSLPNVFYETNSVCFEEHEDYFCTFFKLIKRMLPDINIDPIMSSFQKDQELTNEVLQQDIFDHGTLLEKTTQQIPTPKRRIAKLLFVASTLVGTVYLGLSFHNISKGSWFNRTDSKTSSSIRSDLLVPTDNIFLKRPNVITKIAEGLKEKQGIQTVAIVGIGGAGKTTIARQYALKQNANIVWEINAETRESIKDSFEHLAYALCKSEEERKRLMGLQGIKNKIERDEKILLLVKEKLKQYSNWFLIYDNVNKFTSIQQYFPCDSKAWGEGKVIITTTDSNTKNNSLINNFVYIGELSPNEKLNLFMNIMGNETSHTFTPSQAEQARTFLNDVPPFPLDVSIAAYYLKSTNTPYAKYLEKLKEDSTDFETIQEDVVKEASGYTKTRYSIVSLSLKQLIETHRDFADLLTLISLLDYQNIPRPLLSSYKSDIVVDNFIYNLKKYSLITSETSVNSISTVSFHRATQEILLTYLTKALALSNKSPLINDIALSLESYMVETIENEDFSRMKLLVPHCEAFLNRDPLLNSKMEGSIGGALGCIYYYLRYNLQAKQHLETSLASLNPHEINNQDKIARILAYLGSFYRAQGDYEKAKTFLEQSLIIYEKTPNHVKSTRALGYLGVVYRDLGDYKRAKLLLEQSLEIHEKNAQNQIGHAWIQAHLGNIYAILGDYKKANLLLEKSLLIYKKQAEDYVGVGWVLGYLSNVYRGLGDFQKARTLAEQSLTITRSNFSDSHIYVASRLAILGAVYNELGDYQKARSLFEESLHIYEKEYGKNHNDTARVLKLLGETYCLEGDVETAEELLNKALLVFQLKKSPEAYKSLESLGDLYLKKGKIATAEGDFKHAQSYNIQALNYFNQALAMTKEYFQEDSPHTLRIKVKLNSMPMAQVA